MKQGGERSRTPQATRILLVALALSLAGAVGCGGDDDDEPTTQAPGAAEATALQDEIADLPDEEQIKRVGAAWADQFGKSGNEAMCEYLHPDLAGGCSQFVEGALTGSVSLQESYAGAKVKTVEVKGSAAVTEFSNGERVEFKKDSNDEWKVIEVER